MPRYRGDDESIDFDDDDVDCYDCLASRCRCHEPPEEKNALQELSEAVTPTTMALALTRAGVIDDE